AGAPRHPVFVALAETISKCDIPKTPFADLLRAFRKDQTVTRYQTFDDLLGYCHDSANPVGRLVLYVCGYRDEERQKLSDFTCTALQMANFWQDVSVDYVKTASIFRWKTSQNTVSAKKRLRPGETRMSFASS